MFYKLEYIWLDGNDTPNIRSKTKIVSSKGWNNDIDTLEKWSFDGSSTKQAEGGNSDCELKPVKIIHDPTRKNSFLVLCEVNNADGTPHETNNRAKLREVYDEYKNHECLYGFEQEYTLIDLDTQRPLGFPETGYPEEQGKYYCGVGAEQVKGRDIVEEHLEACLKANILVSGINAEVMLGQWEYQVGPLPALEVGDQMILSRYLLHKIAEKYNVGITLDPKPEKGNWNGSGCHINFSTKETMGVDGIDYIHAICKGLEHNHAEHMAEYGEDNDQRMTGELETSSIDDFSVGVSDRGCSIRIPLKTNQDGRGYLEDRRPASNVEPYKGARILMKTACEVLERKYEPVIA